jgi:hypothetical protein
MPDELEPDPDSPDQPYRRLKPYARGGNVRPEQYEVDQYGPRPRHPYDIGDRMLELNPFDPLGSHMLSSRQFVDPFQGSIDPSWILGKGIEKAEIDPLDKLSVLLASRRLR